MQHHHKISYLLHKQITEIYITSAIRTFALSTIAVFLPIFLLQSGYTLTEVIGYKIIQHVVMALFVKKVLQVISKKGIKHSIILSIPFTFLYFILIYNLEPLQALLGNLIALFTLALIQAIFECHYWTAFHVDFAKVHDDDKASQQVGILKAVSVILTIVGPLTGALVVNEYSFQVLFVIVTMLLIAAVVPLTFSKEIHEPLRITSRRIFTKHEAKKNKHFIAEGFRDIAARILWPLLMFYLALSLKEIGGVYTISSTILAILTWKLGKRLTKDNQYRILKTGGALHALSLSARTFFSTFSLISLAQGVGALSWGLIHVPFFSIFYKNSKREGITKTVYTREVYVDIGRVASLALLGVLLLFTDVTTALTTVIITGAVSTFIMVQIRED